MLQVSLTFHLYFVSLLINFNVGIINIVIFKKARSL
jgi:hypothetical protein